MARRTSYASALAGPAGASNSTPPGRSGFLPGTTVGTALQLSSYLLSANNAPARNYDHPRAYSGRRQSTPDSYEFDQQQQQQHRQLPSFGNGKWSDGLGGTMVEPRAPAFFTPSYLRTSRHMDRLEERYRSRERAQREGGSRSARSSIGGAPVGAGGAGTGGRSRSGSGVNLQKMVPSHRGMTYEIQERHVPTPEAFVAALPCRWSSHEKAVALEVSLDGLEVKFGGQSKGAGKDDAASVRADQPIPKACGIYYFEVTVLGRAKDGLVSMGFIGPTAALNRPPGWEPDSYAYHGDDGFKFGGHDDGTPYAAKFTTGDIIGCGIDYATGSVFFTKNGAHNGIAFKDVKSDQLFPAVGLKKPGEHVKANFGQEPFAFDIDGLVESERDELRALIECVSASSLHPREASESQLMQELVGQYLSQEGYTESTKAFAAEVKETITHLRGPEAAEASTVVYEEDPNAVKRQKIRSAVLEGRIQEAIDSTNRWFDGVLRENEDIFFKLRCRKFIELIKRSADLQPRLAKPLNSSKRHSKRLSRTSIGTNGHGHRSRDSVSHVDAEREEGSIDASIGVSDEVQAQQSTLMHEALVYGRKLQNDFKDDPRREVRQALEDTFALIAYPDARESSLAYLLGEAHRVPVAEELNSAILISLGQSSTAALERLVKQTEVLLTDISTEGRSGALLNLTKHYLQ